jgi:hypothetical protein
MILSPDQLCRFRPPWLMRDSVGTSPFRFRFNPKASRFIRGSQARITYEATVAAKFGSHGDATFILPDRGLDHSGSTQLKPYAMPFSYTIILDERAAHNFPLGLFGTVVVGIQRTGIAITPNKRATARRFQFMASASTSYDFPSMMILCVFIFLSHQWARTKAPCGPFRRDQSMPPKTSALCPWLGLLFGLRPIRWSIPESP